MKKLLLVGLALLVCSWAYGMDYTWIGTSAGAGSSFTSPANWDNGLGGGGSSDWPNDPTDRAIIANGKRADLALPTESTFVLGEMYVGNGSSFERQSQNLTFILTDNSGCSGNWWYVSATDSSSWNGLTTTWDIRGNFYQPTTVPNPCAEGYYGLIKMRGDGKAMRRNYPTNIIDIQIYGSGVWDNNTGYTLTGSLINGGVVQAYPRHTITVMPGASIGSSSTATGTWEARKFIFSDGQANLPGYKANVNFIYGYQPLVDNYAGRLAITSGLTYPQDLSISAGWNGPIVKRTYEWKLQPWAPGQSGDLTVWRDLKVQSGTTNAVYGYHWLNTLDNTSGVSRNVTVLRDLILNQYDSQSKVPVAQGYWGAKFNDSQVKVGRDFIVGSADSAWDGWWARDRGLVDLGNATIRVGRNFMVTRMDQTARQLWNRANTSTVIFDGNGTTATQTIRIYGDDGMSVGEHTPLHNVTVNTKGTVQLDTTRWGGLATGSQTTAIGQDNAIRYTTLVLTGNLRVDCGTFKCNGRDIYFTGKGQGLTVNTGGTFDTTTTANANIYWRSGGDNQASAMSVRNFHANPLDAGETTGIWRIGYGSGPTVVQLLSDVRISGLYFDNGPGNAIVLNGHTLSIGGSLITTKTTYGGGIEGTIYQSWSELAPIPEPATMLLLGSGALMLLGRARRRRMKN